MNKSHHSHWLPLEIILLGLGVYIGAAQEFSGQAGGGPPARAANECVSLLQRQQGEELAINLLSVGGGAQRSYRLVRPHRANNE